jgi:hypothetical protein
LSIEKKSREKEDAGRPRLSEDESRQPKSIDFQLSLLLMADYQKLPQVDYPPPYDGQQTPPPPATTIAGHTVYTIPATTHVIIQEEPMFPVGLCLFILGFFFPIAWFIGGCLSPQTRSEYTWYRANRIMTILVLVSIFLVVLPVLFFVVFAHHEVNQHLPSDSWPSSH